MTTEEKAKAYDEAIEIINSKWHYKNKPCFIDVAEIFPELKDSEDDRIRKELVDYLKDLIPHTDLDLVRKSKVWIEWLEKQGESYTKKDVDDAWLKGICDAKRELEKQGEQKQKEYSLEELDLKKNRIMQWLLGEIADCATSLLKEGGKI